MLESLGNVVLSLGAKLVPAKDFIGYTGRNIPEQYKVTFTSRKGPPISFALQDKFSMGLENTWDSIMSLFGDSEYLDIANVLVQFVSGGKNSVAHKDTARRFWKNGSPLKMTLNLKVDAEESPDAVKDALLFMSKLASPKETEHGFLAPPGPSPFRVDASSGVGDAGKASADLKKAYNELFESSDYISVQIGNCLLLENVIVKMLNADIFNMMLRTGQPAAADFSVEIQTYSIMTTQMLEAAFAMKPYVPVTPSGLLSKSTLLNKLISKTDELNKAQKYLSGSNNLLTDAGKAYGALT